MRPGTTVALAARDTDVQRFATRADPSYGLRLAHRRTGCRAARSAVAHSAQSHQRTVSHVRRVQQEQILGKVVLVHNGQDAVPERELLEHGAILPECWLPSVPVVNNCAVFGAFRLHLHGPTSEGRPRRAHSSARSQQEDSLRSSAVAACTSTRVGAVRGSLPAGSSSRSCG